MKRLFAGNKILKNGKQVYELLYLCTKCKKNTIARGKSYADARTILNRDLKKEKIITQELQNNKENV
jgi:hypothetical protein